MTAPDSLTVNDRRVIVEPIERLQSILAYDEKTGDLVWRERLPEHFGVKARKCDVAGWNTRNAGKRVTRIVGKRGYLTICLDNKRIAAHRICYAIFHGRWPDGSIDHIDGDRTNNRIANLREVSVQENARNMRLKAGSRTGVTGVYQRRDRGDWTARITVDGTNLYLGVFADFDAAVAARKDAERRYGFHRNHGRSLEGASAGLLGHVFGVSHQRASAIFDERCAACGKAICRHSDSVWGGR